MTTAAQTPTSYRILIVEDMVIIADSIRRYLKELGHQVTNAVMSYDEALDAYAKEKPDLVLLDIKLKGKKTGFDVAAFLRQQQTPPPFIFLTSQTDIEHIVSARQFAPGGYLSKPLQKNTLKATIEVVMFNHQEKEREAVVLQLKERETTSKIGVSNILYLKAEHVYVEIMTNNSGSRLRRGPLSDLLDRLPPKQFKQTHRGFAVNKGHVTRWDAKHVYIGQTAIPISRSRRKEIVEWLEN
ncbi:MAG: response regulator transcription factor [Bacteroidota bacterium]